jgi:hypothetical protein
MSVSLWHCSRLNSQIAAFARYYQSSTGQFNATLAIFSWALRLASGSKILSAINDSSSIFQYCSLDSSGSIADGQGGSLACLNT